MTEFNSIDTEVSQPPLSEHDGGNINNTAAAAMLSALASAALTACGGGDAADQATGGLNERASAAATSAGATLPALPTWANPDYFNAWRFLNQASMGARDADTLAVTKSSCADWITNQLALVSNEPLPADVPSPPAKGPYLTAFDGHNIDKNTGTQTGFNTEQLNFPQWYLPQQKPDQLRHRVVHALSQFLVISTSHDIFSDRTYLPAGYLDMLSRYALRNFRDILKGVATSPAMGHYLTHFANLPPKFEGVSNEVDPKTNATLAKIPLTTSPPGIERIPDQNFARELLQLFSIGLTKLNMDGTEVLVNNQPVPTTTTQDIVVLSNVFTGWAYQKTLPTGVGVPYTDKFTTEKGQVVEYTDDETELHNQFGEYGGVKEYYLEMLPATRLSSRNWAPMVGHVTTQYSRTPWMRDSAGQVILSRGNIVYDDAHIYYGEKIRAHSTQNLLAAQLRTAEGSVTFLGKPFTLGASPAESLELALNVIFAHPNLAPFVAKQMIQHMVTSNPSKAYVQRVAQAFKQSGFEMGTLVKYILLDNEARQAVYANANTYGRLREPYLRIMAMARGIGWQPMMPHLTDQVSSATPALNLNQSPLRATSVFNHFSPTYQYARGKMATQNKVIPQMQIATESSVIAYVNAVQAIIAGGPDGFNGIDFSSIPATETSTPAKILAYINMRLFGGAMSAELKSIVLAAASGTGAIEERFKSALFISVISTEFLVQR